VIPHLRLLPAPVIPWFYLHLLNIFPHTCARYRAGTMLRQDHLRRGRNRQNTWLRPLPCLLQPRATLPCHLNTTSRRTCMLGGQKGRSGCIRRAAFWVLVLLPRLRAVAGGRGRQAGVRARQAGVSCVSAGLSLDLGGSARCAPYAPARPPLPSATLPLALSPGEGRRTAAHVCPGACARTCPVPSSHTHTNSLATFRIGGGDAWRWWRQDGQDRGARKKFLCCIHRVASSFVFTDGTAKSTPTMPLAYRGSTYNERRHSTTWR